MVQELLSAGGHSDHADSNQHTISQIATDIGKSIVPMKEILRLAFPHSLTNANQQEWIFRMYSTDSIENRDNRTSFYLFNLNGGEGTGSYVQESVEPGRWYHYLAVVDMRTDTITWYKNGQFKDQDPFINSEYHIHPNHGTAPVRIGTRDFASYFKGAIDNINIYNRALSAFEIGQLYADRTP